VAVISSCTMLSTAQCTALTAADGIKNVIYILKLYSNLELAHIAAATCRRR
jgi:hypothetical protein